MPMTRDRELQSIYTQAKDIARQTSQVMSSAHLLLALYTVPNHAASFLEDRHLTVDALLNALKGLPPEDPRVLERIEARARRLAEGSNADRIDSLHLLAALIRENTGQAYHILESAGANVSAIRASVMSYATGSRAMRGPSSRPQTGSSPAVARQTATEHAPSPILIHPSLMRMDVRATQTETLPPATEPPARPRTEPPTAKTAPKPEATPEDALKEAQRTAKRLANLLFKGKPPKKAPDEPARERSTTGPMSEAAFEALNTPTPVVAETPSIIETPSAEAVHEPVKVIEAKSEHADAEPIPVTVPPETVAPARLAEHATNEPDIRMARLYALDPDDFPNLTRFGRNLTEEAALGNIDSVVGRDKEINQLIDIVGKRRSNNPLLLGDAGVGKTAIVEGLALEFVKLARQGSRLGRRAIIEIEVGRILGGTHLRGSLSERLIGIKDEVKRANGDVIVFLDEIHMWMNAGAGGDGTDAAGELKTALARGEFPCVGATTHDEFRKFVETDPAFERRFQAVFVEEPDTATTLHILNGIREHYEDHHHVTYDDDALQTVVRLAQRFIHERRLPDKAIGVMDLAGSRAARTGAEQISSADIATIVAELAGIPAERLTQTDRERFIKMEEIIGEQVIGHSEVIHRLSEIIRRNYAGFHSNRPIGSLLFLGPTGVGKTELVKALADFLFFDREALVRFDMSEFMESHSVSRLIGPPPGYIGFEKGGQLTEAVRRRPYQVVLLDEIEKAHPDVLNILLQFLDEGRLTDGRGRAVDFSNCVVVMTSNLGATVFTEGAGPRIGFGQTANAQDVTDTVISRARDHFPAELWNRIDERLVFQPLTKSEVARIASLQLRNSALRLREESEIDLVFGDGIIPWLVENGGYDPEFGARPMRQTIERRIEAAVARMILMGDATRGDRVFVDVEAGELVMKPEV